MEDPKYRSLMDYAFRALARRMHTSMELREKLRKRPHHSKEQEDLILTRLGELKLIDDEAFLKRHIENAQHSRHEGYLKTAFKLKLKGIPMDETKRHWKETGVDETEIARAALAKIQKKLEKIPAQKRYSRQAGYLASRGFSSDTIYKILSHFEDR